MGYTEQTEKLSYLAGIIEGEGCIGVRQNKKQVSPAVSCGNCDFEPIFMLRDEFGGRIAVRNKLKLPDHYKDHIVWSVCHRKALTVAMKLFPFMHMRRRKQAALDIMNFYLRAKFDDR